MSSAKRYTADLTISGKSFMNTTKSTGPNTLPWGIPLRTLIHSETANRCFLPVRNTLIHWSRFPVIPYRDNLYSSLLWGKDSKFKRFLNVHSILTFGLFTLRHVVYDNVISSHFFFSICSSYHLLPFRCRRVTSLLLLYSQAVAVNPSTFCVSLASFCSRTTTWPVCSSSSNFLKRFS